MIDLQITVKLDDGTEWELKPSIGTFVKFERHFKMSVQALSNGTAGIEHVVWLAWEQARHEGRAVTTFDHFVDKVEDLQMGKTDAPLVATPSPTT